MPTVRSCLSLSTTPREPVITSAPLAITSARIHASRRLPHKTGAAVSWLRYLSFRFLFRRPVGEDEDAVRTDRLRVHEPHGPRLSHVLEEAFAWPDDDREDHQAVLVDEIVLHERPCQFPAAEDQDVLAVLLLEPRNCLGDVPLDEGRVVPLQRLLQRPRGDVLG